MAFYSYSKDYQGFVDIVLNDPSRYLPIVEFLDTVVCKESELSQAERELIGAYVSILNGCDFCYGVHEAVAKSLNIEEALLSALKNDIQTAPMDDKLKAIFTFTHKITLTPSKLNQADIQAVVDSGWSEKTAEDVVAVASIFALLNRLVDGFGIKGSADYFAAIGAGFTQQAGYESFVRSQLAAAS